MKRGHKDTESQSQDILPSATNGRPIYDAQGNIAMARWKCGLCGQEGSKDWLDYYHQNCKGRGLAWKP